MRRSRSLRFARRIARAISGAATAEKPAVHRGSAASSASRRYPCRPRRTSSPWRTARRSCSSPSARPPRARRPRRCTRAAGRGTARRTQSWRRPRPAAVTSLDRLDVLVPGGRVVRIQRVCGDLSPRAVDLDFRDDVDGHGEPGVLEVPPVEQEREREEGHAGDPGGHRELLLLMRERAVGPPPRSRRALSAIRSTSCSPKASPPVALASARTKAPLRGTGRYSGSGAPLREHVLVRRQTCTKIVYTPAADGTGSQAAVEERLRFAVGEHDHQPAVPRGRRRRSCRSPGARASRGG